MKMENTKHHRLTSFAETASEAPLQEPDRQYYFIEKAKDIFAENGEQYFRDLETQRSAMWRKIPRKQILLFIIPVLSGKMQT